MWRWLVTRSGVFIDVRRGIPFRELVLTRSEADRSSPARARMAPRVSEHRFARRHPLVHPGAHARDSGKSGARLYRALFLDGWSRSTQRMGNGLIGILRFRSGGDHLVAEGPNASPFAQRVCLLAAAPGVSVEESIRTDSGSSSQDGGRGERACVSVGPPPVSSPNGWMDFSARARRDDGPLAKARSSA